MGEHQGEQQVNGAAKRRRGSSRKIPLLVTWVPSRGVERIIGKLADFEHEVLRVESVQELLETTRQLRSPGCIILPSGDGQGFELSTCEWDVLCLMQQGRTTNEIAERLFVCPATSTGSSVQRS